MLCSLARPDGLALGEPYRVVGSSTSSSGLLSQSAAVVLQSGCALWKCNRRNWFHRAASSAAPEGAAWSVFIALCLAPIAPTSVELPIEPVESFPKIGSLLVRRHDRSAASGQRQRQRCGRRGLHAISCLGSLEASRLSSERGRVLARSRRGRGLCACACHELPRGCLAAVVGSVS